MNKDIILNLIKEEENRQIKSIGLIASENFVSPQVLKATSSILTNKYAEGYPEKRYYAGCHIIDNIEKIAIERIKKLFKATYANVQPHSGTQANNAVYMACLNPGDKIIGLDLYHGGHLTHGSNVNFSGKIYRSLTYGVNKKTGLIDYNNLMFLVKKEKPKLIICGASSYSRDIKYQIFRNIADSVGAILLGDISHPAGLIATGFLNNPFPYCHIVTTTTHKTLRGPRGGAILIEKDFDNPLGIKNSQGVIKKMSEVINQSVFPGCQGGPLEHIIAAKAISFKEASTKYYKNYIKQVLINSKILSKLLISKGYKIISNGTDNHCILIDLNNKNITGKYAEKILEDADIICNKNVIPFDNKPVSITSGIRLGTPGITTRGIKEKEIEKIVDWIDEILTKKNYSSINNIKIKVNSLMKNYPLFNMQSF